MSENLIEASLEKVTAVARAIMELILIIEQLQSHLKGFHVYVSIQ